MVNLSVRNYSVNNLVKEWFPRRNFLLSPNGPFHFKSPKVVQFPDL